MNPLAETATFLRDVGVISSAAIAVGAGAYRWLIKPRVVVPAMAFLCEVKRGVETVQRMEPDVASMKAALGPNGGRSLSDVIHRTAGRVNLMIDSHAVPTWEASMDGLNTRVNPAFEMLLGYSAADLRGNGWKNVVHPDDADDYFDAWESAVSDVRPFRCPRARFITRDGRVLSVSVVAAPASLGMDSSAHIWMGSVRVEP